jgi:hypothetical protein
MSDEEGGGGGESKSIEKVDQKPSPAPTPPALRADDDISLGASVDISPERQAAKFTWVARGLWAGVLLSVVVQMLVAYYPPTHGGTIISFLAMLQGGLLASAVMAGRLTDNRLELARTRKDLDRKAAECAKLQAEFVKNLKSSQAQLTKGKGKKR